MTEVNVLNAITQERARIREAVVNIPVDDYVELNHGKATMTTGNDINDPYIRRSEILKILHG